MEADRDRSVLIPILIVAVLLIVSSVQLFPSGLNGVWLKKSGGIGWPDEMRLERKRNELRMKYWDQGGTTTVTWRCDGQEHPSSTSGEFQNVYRAELTDGTLTVTKETKGFSEKSLEHWSVDANNRELTISTQKGITVFERAPFYRLILRGHP